MSKDFRDNGIIWQKDYINAPMLDTKNFITATYSTSYPRHTMRFFSPIFIAALCFVLSIQASPLPFMEQLLGKALSAPLNDAQSRVEKELNKVGGGAALKGLSTAQENVENGSGVHVLGGAVPRIGEKAGVNGDNTASASKSGGQATTGTAGQSVPNEDDRT